MAFLKGRVPVVPFKVTAAERNERPRPTKPILGGVAMMMGNIFGMSELSTWRYKSNGLALPPIELGTPEICTQQPQQPHWQGRITTSVAPDQRTRSSITRTGRNDDPPYPDQGPGPNKSIRSGAIVFTTSALEAAALMMHQHDRRLIVTQSPSGLPASELRTLRPTGFMSRGQGHNAYQADADNHSPELAMDMTGVFATINRSGAFIPANVPLAAVLPRRIVSDAEDRRNFLEGKMGKIPGPAVKSVENIKDEFELDLVPVPMNIFQRLNDVLYVKEMRAIRLGFKSSNTDFNSFRPLDYDPLACIELLRGVVQADLDQGRCNVLLESEGINAILHYRMLSVVVGFINLMEVNRQEVPEDVTSWRTNAERLVAETASRKITLVQFVEAKQGENGSVLDGSNQLLATAKERLAKLPFFLRETLTEETVQLAIRYAAGGLDAALAIWNAACNQMYQQTMGGVFCMSITPSLPGRELEILKM